MSPSPFYGTTPRYALRKLLGTSNIFDIDSGFDALATDVENAFAGYKSGTSAARLAATNIDGLLWRETDTGLFYLGTGTAWFQVPLAGAWVALTLATNIGVGTGYTPSARLVGDRVWLKGAPLNNTGGTLGNGAAIATVPSGLRPGSTVGVPASPSQTGGAAGVIWLQVTPGGSMTLGATGTATLGTGASLSLEGSSYSIA